MASVSETIRVFFEVPSMFASRVEPQWEVWKIKPFSFNDPTLTEFDSALKSIFFRLEFIERTKGTASLKKG